MSSINTDDEKAVEAFQKGYQDFKKNDGICPSFSDHIFGTGNYQPVSGNRSDYDAGWEAARKAK